jgi:hypothetical protein
MIERDTWQYRAIQFCRGNQTPLGTILLAVIGRNAKNPPWYGTAAEIRADGLVVSSFTDRHRKLHYPALVCGVTELVDMFSRLADDLKLADADRIEMFRQVRQWCARDLRRGITLHFRG